MELTVMCSLCVSLFRKWSVIKEEKNLGHDNNTVKPIDPPSPIGSRGHSPLKICIFSTPDPPQTAFVVASSTCATAGEVELSAENSLTTIKCENIHLTEIFISTRKGC
ncbi:hypothetical protein CDAR_61341 [Caerostris darwini]|uniref:Uncharacterized protein n=1 Tax=Caerostris darwini TaxID=1538125 RepID=A0AAV4X054_9ARAC|nr:hypothetical protein CDAR_61341 [Caerostris darwini]